jgi:tetratricopeptide (TPR) repeat protein
MAGLFGSALALLAREIEVPTARLDLTSPEARKLVEKLDMSNVPAVLKEAQKLARQFPDKIEFWHIVGSLQAQMGEYDQALASLERGLTGQATDLAFLLLQARIHEDRAQLGPGGSRAGGMVSYKAAAMQGVDAAAFKQAQLRQAAEKFARALQIQPGVRVYQAKHAALLLDAGDAAAALAAAENYLQENPENPDLLLVQAKAAVALEQWAKAGTAARHCVQQRAGEAEACGILATIEDREGRKEAAAAWRQQAGYYAYIPEFLAVPYTEENARKIAPLLREAETMSDDERKAWAAAATAAIDRLIAEQSDDATRLLAVICYRHEWHGRIEDRIYHELEARKAEGVLMALFDRANSFCTVGSCAPALARLGSETAFPLIIERLPSDRNMFPMELPEALVIYGRTEAVAPLGQALKDAIGGERQSMANLGNNPMAAIGTGYFASRCIWALAAFKTPEARRVLDEVAADKRHGTEATAALFLQTREPSYFSRLMKQLRKDPADAESVADRFKVAGLAEAAEVSAIAEKAAKAAQGKKKKT